MNNFDAEKRKTKGRFLVAVCAFIFNKDKILVTKRSESRDHDPGKWECVSGRFNQNFSSVEDEITREIGEELGPGFKFRLVAPVSFYHFYRANILEDELVGINYICEYLGGGICLTEEHTAFDWVKPEEFIKRDIHPLLKNDIEHLVKIKDFYLKNKEVFVKEFKKSN